MSAAYQIELALSAPEPIEARQAQRDQERDRSLDSLSAVRADLIAIADRVALEVLRRDGSVTAPQLLLDLRAAGYGAMLDAVDARFIAAILLPSRGWRAVGLANHGSKSRPVKVWTRLSPEAWRVAQLEKALERAQAASSKASEARAALPAGSSRKRVTSANARWMRKAEERDRIAAQLEQARAAVSSGEGAS